MPADAFADDVIEELLSRTEKGEPLLRLCEDPRMPARKTVYNWLEDDGEFAAQFRAARARGVHALAEECIGISDEPSKDAVAAADKRIRIDTRLRLAGKWLPSIYGDKTAHIGGAPDDPPINTVAQVIISIPDNGRG